MSAERPPRREFLVGTAAGVAGLLLPDCGGDRVRISPEDGGVDGGDAGGTDAGVDSGFDAGPPPDCDDPADGSELVEVLTLPDTTLPLDVPVGEGESRRLYRDLSEITPEALVVPNDLFYIRTGFDPLVSAKDWEANWELRITGLVAEEQTFTIADLRKYEEDMGRKSLECSGNGAAAGFGLLSSANWSGVPIETVLGWVEPFANTRIHFKGINRYDPTNPNVHTSWIYTRDQLVDAGAFLALGMNGDPLPLDHGFPCRLICPRWYGCCNTKWLREIEFVADDVPASQQMLEYITRTHQPGSPTLARDFIPAVIDIAAVVGRVEKRQRDGELYYLVHGVLWGGTEPVERLVFTPDGFETEIECTICPANSDNDTWTVWWAEWRPTKPGKFTLQCRVELPGQRQRRLDSGFYNRPVLIWEV